MIDERRGGLTSHSSQGGKQQHHEMSGWSADTFVMSNGDSSDSSVTISMSKG